jgi:hypothetical protein
MLKTLVYRALRFLYRSRKLILLIAVIVLITLVFNFLIFSWIGNNADSNNNNEDEDRTIPARGTIDVRGLEIYGGDIITADSGSVYLYWGELTLGASKNASFYVLSNSNVNVTLGLNVTAWDPAGLEDYFNISWDYNGTELSSGPDREPIFVTLNLKVASSKEFIDFLIDNSVTSFGFDITVYASGV